ncbi:MAG: 50S ribosomal protein L24e [Thermoplasmatota archaeon]
MSRVCSFSGEEIEPGTGLLFVKKDGTVLHFKNRKALRNMLGLGRVNRHVKWTRAYERGN